MLVEHPGRLFIQRHGKPETRDDVLAYVQFLRDESGLDGTLPVDLERIYRRFGMSPQTYTIARSSGSARRIRNLDLSSSTNPTRSGGNASRRVMSFSSTCSSHCPKGKDGLQGRG